MGVVAIIEIAVSMSFWDVSSLESRGFFSVLGSLSKKIT
jgi:hypothetical protein